MTVREKIMELAAFAQQHEHASDDGTLWRAAVELMLDDLHERLERLEAQGE